MGTTTFSDLLGKSSTEELLNRNRTLSRRTRQNPELMDSLKKAAETVKGENEMTLEVFMSVLKADPVLAEEARDKEFHDGLQNYLEAVVDEQQFKADPAKLLAANLTDKTEPSRFTLDDWRLKLLALILKIPDAHPGDIITSEHHNSLRNAIKALAMLIGDAEKTSIHTIAPIFLPIDEDKDDENQGRREWKLFVDKAVVPSIREQGRTGGTIQGGCLVRLPDNAQVQSMIVRGRRLDDQADNPKSFEIVFLQIDPNIAKPPLKELIKFELKAEKGFFTQVEKPTSAIEIDNEKFHYYVVAVWKDADNSSGFEVRSIQFICEQ